MRILITDGTIINKINRNTDSYYLNEKDIDTESLNLQNTSPIIPDKSFYTPTISILIPSTQKSLISANETPFTRKSTNLSTDHHHKTPQNSSNLIHASTDDLHAEMIFDLLQLVKYISSRKRLMKNKFYRINKRKNVNQ